MLFPPADRPSESMSGRQVKQMRITGAMDMIYFFKVSAMDMPKTHLIIQDKTVVQVG